MTVISDRRLCSWATCGRQLPTQLKSHRARLSCSYLLVSAVKGAEGDFGAGEAAQALALERPACPGTDNTTQHIDLMGSNMDSWRQFPTKDSVISRRHSLSTYVWVSLDTVVAGRKAGVKPIVPTIARSRVGCVALAPFPAILVDFAPFNVRHAEAGVCNETRIGRLMYYSRVKYSGVGEILKVEGNADRGGSGATENIGS